LAALEVGAPHFQNLGSGSVEPASGAWPISRWTIGYVTLVV
jgi:hypothetical protein